MQLAPRAKELFDFFDVNGDGAISRKEFILVVETLVNEKGRGVSQAYFSDADLNSDNKVSYQEFVVLLKNIDLG